MATSGAYGFRSNEKDKVTFCKYDSYPAELGRYVMFYVAKTPLEKMKEVAAKIVLVDGQSMPPPQLTRKYEKYADAIFPETSRNWEWLLFRAQGDLFRYNKGIPHMTDDHTFLHDSLHCEWAYIINLDTRTFEVYRGGNKSKNARGRYASKSIKDNRGFKGVALKKEIPILKIAKENIESLVLQLERI